MPGDSMIGVFGFEIDPYDQGGLIAAQLISAGATLSSRLAEPAVACQILDAHVGEGDGHSCLGCNLQVAVCELADFLSLSVDPYSAVTHLHLGLHLSNTLWERMSDVCRTLEVPKRLWDAPNTYSTFRLTRRWTNFMKHPNFFGLGIHHPIYVAGDSSAAAAAALADGKRTKTDRQWALIDQAAVEACWKDDNNAAARKLLEPSFTACVVLPNIETLADGLCQEFTQFVSMITEPTWVGLAKTFAVYEEPCSWW